jgi:myo-inositol-1(or 4)-monophosphatase
MDLSQIENTAIDTARQAGAIIKRGADKQKTISTKSSEIDLLTEYDKEVDSYIAGRITSEFPGHRIESEEGPPASHVPGDTSESYIWHVDPIDGTINFVHGYPVYAVSLALYKGSQPLVSVIYDPTRDECFSAVSGQGAWLSSGDVKRPIQVSAAKKLIDSVLATGFPYDRHHSSDDNLAQITGFLKRARGLRRSGSAAIDLAYVAAGRLDGFWELILNSWDVAAGVLLITEAGGKVTDKEGQPFQMRQQVSITASNGSIHGAMLAVLRESSSHS